MNQVRERKEGGQQPPSGHGLAQPGCRGGAGFLCRRPVVAHGHPQGGGGMNKGVMVEKVVKMKAVDFVEDGGGGDGGLG